MYDGKYRANFDDLCVALENSFTDPAKKERLRAHRNNTETCGCRCHPVSEKEPLPAQRPHGTSA